MDWKFKQIEREMKLTRELLGGLKGDWLDWKKRGRTGGTVGGLRIKRIVGALEGQF